jgi:hypothetical protein
VPLSDHERRRLQQMEQALSAEDPQFAAAMRRRRSVSRPRLLVGIGVLLVGLVLLVAGVVAQAIPLGAIGFITMLAGTAYAFSGRRRRGGPTGVVAGDGTSQRATRRRRSGFIQRLEHRWDRRRGGQ